MTTTHTQNVSKKNAPASKTDQARAQREAKAEAATTASKKPATPTPAVVESAPAETPKPKKPRVSPVHKATVRAATVRTRIRVLTERVAKWNQEGGHVEKIQAHLAAASACIESALKDFDAIPADWSSAAPRGASAGSNAGGGGSLAVGTLVGVREKYRATYEDVLEPAEMDELTVKAQRGKKVICSTAKGDTLIIERRELEVKQTAN